MWLRVSVPALPMPIRPPSRVHVFLRSVAFVALALGIARPVEHSTFRASGDATPAIVARVIASSKLAMIPAAGPKLKVTATPMLKRWPVTRGIIQIRLSVETAGTPRHRAFQVCFTSFPRVLVVRRSIPRLGAEEPPWRSLQV
jgi:hypothetical protein